jgi:hypothetical protein
LEKNSVAFDTELKMFRLLHELQGLTTLPLDLQTVYNSYSGSDIEKCVQFEAIYQNAVTMTDTEASQHLSLINNIETLYQTAKAIRWYTVDSLGNLTINTLEKANFEATLAQLEQKKADLAAFLAVRRQAVDNELTNMSTVNNSIGTQATVSGQNLKTINGLLIQRLDSSFSGFLAADSLTISGIAMQCVGQGGEAVYTARSLLAEATKGEEPAYSDECIQPLGSPAPPAFFKPTGTAGLSPNPASGKMQLTLPTDHEVGQVIISDSFGRSLKVIELEKGQIQMDIDVSKMPAGIYFLTDIEGAFAPVRFVVSK